MTEPSLFLEQDSCTTSARLSQDCPRVVIVWRSYDPNRQPTTSQPPANRQPTTSQPWPNLPSTPERSNPFNQLANENGQRRVDFTHVSVARRRVGFTDRRPTPDLVRAPLCRLPPSLRIPSGS
ncbi:hypothetical protein Bbelb_355320 [Branchiostoma belcheri]|nr:hypothetical protein Bbelb_355320 [Branchiostoma belcheri]